MYYAEPFDISVFAFSVEASFHIIEFAAHAVHKSVERFFGIIAYWCVYRKSEIFSHRFVERTVPAVLVNRFESVYNDGSVAQRARAVGYYFVRGKTFELTEPRAAGAGTERRVE